MRRSIGPRGVCVLPLGVAAELSVHSFCDYFFPSGVRSLPLDVAAERSVHYYYCQGQPQQASFSRAEISFSSNISSHPPTPEKVVQGTKKKGYSKTCRTCLVQLSLA